MQEKKNKTISPTADRMGRFIGQLRNHEGVTLGQLAHGLCAPSFLGKIENGEREVGKQLTDAFFQRLGKPVELFERILDWGEFQRWARRQEIIAFLHRGEAENASAAIRSYISEVNEAEVLDRQFARLVEINCRYLSGAAAKDLLPMVRDALMLTQPGFLSTPVEDLLLSQNEGRLLFAYLRLREETEGAETVAADYRALLRYFKQERYESRERVYLFPYVACRVIEYEYKQGNYSAALTTCLDAVEELTREKRLFAYDQLLVWKQKLFDAMGIEDRTPEKLLAQLQKILSQIPERRELLIPCDERGHVYCLNQVIRSRRRLLGISQETLADGICEPRTLSRIENYGGNLHRKNRKELLQRVNMSGERYDYEVITDQYEDYILRSELDRAIVLGKWDSAVRLLSLLHQRVPDIPTNRQYLQKNEAQIDEARLHNSDSQPSEWEMKDRLEAAIGFTLPMDIEKIGEWPVGSLSVNEILTLIEYAFHYKKRRMHEKCLSILLYIKSCLQCSETDLAYYEDLYTRVGINVASVLGDLGRYQESNEVTISCMKLSLENQNTRRISQYLYGIAWNMAQQLPDCPEAERDLLKEEINSTLKKAYAAALLSGNTVRQQRIASYCLKVCGVELEL